MELTLENLAYVGIAASVITQALRLAANRFGWYAPREVANIGLFVVSIGLAVAFFGLPEVVPGDPVATSQAILTAALAVVGSAGLVYNVILDKVLLPVEPA